MMNWIKKQGVAGLLLAVAAICAIVAVIIYGVNSTTGAMQAVQLDVVPIVLTVLGIVILAAAIALNGRVPQWVISAAMVVVVVFLAVSLGNLINNRTDIAGNQWFIPGLDTPEQGACLNGAIACAVFYVLSVVAIVVSAFIGKFNKETA